jgi:hypothetical protein
VGTHFTSRRTGEEGNFAQETGVYACRVAAIMLDQIPEEGEIMGAIKESVRDRGVGPTVIGILGSLLAAGLIGMVVVLSNGWGMTDTDGAKRILSESGYSQISVTGYRWFTCDKHDYFHTGFEATGPTGKHVSGTVCKGMIFKSSTVRLD